MSLENEKTVQIGGEEDETICKFGIGISTFSERLWK